MPEQYLNVLDPYVFCSPVTSHQTHSHPVTNVSNSTNRRLLGRGWWLEGRKQVAMSIWKL